jgi:uncharacterized protein (DUF2132 family)
VLKKENKSKDPLEGVTLEMMLRELVDTYGWEQMALEIKLNCFTNQPTINSSLKLLRRTPWARSQVEDMYRAHILDKQS